MDRHFLLVKKYYFIYYKENITLPLWKEISNFFPEL